MMFQAMAWVVMIFLAAAVTAAPKKPAVTWASDPVRADETVVVMGDGFGEDPMVELDGAMMKPLQVSGHSLKFTLPKDAKAGTHTFRVRSGDAASEPVTLNAPDVWWMQCDEGKEATPGGWLRLFGKCLSLDAQARPRVELKGADGKIVQLAAEPNAYALEVKLPEAIVTGRYAMRVHNGCGGEAGWRRAGEISVIAPVQWKSERFNVRDFGRDTDKAVRAALEKARANGGGVVYFPRGRYQLKDAISVPPGTVLKGEGMGVASIYWSDLKSPPAQLIAGRDFGIEDLAIYCTNHKNVIRVARESARFRMRRVRMRANAFYRLGDAGASFRERSAPAPGEPRGYALLIQGRNSEITECDIQASGTGIGTPMSGWIGPTGPWHCRIANCRIAYGYFGTYFDNLDGLIFENNELAGGVNSGGNFVGTFSSRYARNIYWARNHHHDLYGWDRETFSLDGAGGAYVGKVARSEGCEITLAGDPQYRDYQMGLLAQGKWPAELARNWVGAAVMVLDGTGVGQYRTVVKNEGREWVVDRPWDVPLDETSLISIAVDRGRLLVVGNTFEDGGAVQLYSTALDTIVAENTARRIGGFLAWGMHHKGWAWTPNFRCQFLGNEILEGNGYGGEQAGFEAFSTRKPESVKEFAGPLVRGVVFRRNVCESNAGFSLEHGVAETLVEHCTIKRSDVGFQLKGDLRDVLLRGNVMEDVATPYAGDGVGKVMVAPDGGAGANAATRR